MAWITRSVSFLFTSPFFFARLSYSKKYFYTGYEKLPVCNSVCHPWPPFLIQFLSRSKCCDCRVVNYQFAPINLYILKNATFCDFLQKNKIKITLKRLYNPAVGQIFRFCWGTYARRCLREQTGKNTVADGFLALVGTRQKGLARTKGINDILPIPYVPPSSVVSFRKKKRKKEKSLQCRLVIKHATTD